MMFDNSPIAPPSRWQMVKDHLPILLLVGGAIGLFIGLHTALTTVAVLAAAHVAIGLLVLLVARRKRSTSTPETADR